MTVANLGLAVDSRQAAGAVVDLDALAASAIRTEKATDSMSAGAKRSESATAGLSRTIREATGANDNAARAISRHVQAIQALTAAESRGGSNSYAERAADIQAYGRALDEMRAKVNPAYAAIRQYREQVEQIRTAHRLGAVSADEMAAAISRERQATLGSLAALRERQQAIAASTGASYSSNIAAQFQDIGVTAAMGMSPLQIALQQGTQLSAVFSDLKTQGLGVGAALTSAFASIASPVSLVTLGVVGLSAAMIQYFSGLSSGEAVSDALLRRHAASIDRLKDAYDGALDKVRAVAKESERVAEALERIDQGDLFKQLSEQTADAIVEIRKLSVEIDSAGNIGANPVFAPLEQSVNDLIKSAKDGQPDIALFRERLAEIINTSGTSEPLRNLAKTFLQLTNDADTTSRALIASRSAIEQTGLAASGQIAALKAYGEALNALGNIALPDLTPLQEAQKQLETALANSGGDPVKELYAYEQHEATKTRIKEREAEKQAEIDKRKGEQNAERLVREAEQQEDALARRVEAHQWALLSEEDAENLSLQKRLEDLEEYYEQGKMSLEEYLQWKTSAEEDHAREVEEIRERQAQRENNIRQQQFRVAGEMFGNLATVAEAFGEKGFIAAKAFSIGQAVMNTAEAVTEALASAPPPWNFAAAAAVAAAGAVQIAAIASARPGNARAPAVSGGGGSYSSGGGGGGGGSSGGSASNDNKALNNTMYVSIKGEGPVSQEALRDLMDMMVEAQKNGYQLVVGP
ncbi:phage tail length tape measure family protein [Ancylobacter sp.]|uniref:phage tail length tape measure family protein n=1 Tax=Ancylobacter sp. TaxID=1872567 RepID=UPI003D0D8F57